MRPVIRVLADDPVEDLVRALEQPGVRAVAVVTPERELIAFVTQRDLLRALIPPYILESPALGRVLTEDASERFRRSLEGKRVRDVVDVRRQRHTVNADATLVEVTSIMVRTGDPAVPVVEHDRAVAIITTDDLLRALLNKRVSSPEALDAGQQHAPKEQE